MKRIVLRDGGAMGLRPNGDIATCAPDARDRGLEPWCGSEPTDLDAALVTLDVGGDQNQACGLDEQGAVTCFSCPEGRLVRDRYTDATYLDVSASPMANRDEDWPLLLDDAGQADAPVRGTQLAPSGRVRRVAQTRTRYWEYAPSLPVDCGITDQGLECNELTFDGDFVDVTAHDGHVCALSAAAPVRCWSTEADAVGEGADFEWFVRMTEVAMPDVELVQMDLQYVGGIQLCGLDSRGRIQCVLQDDEDGSWTEEPAPAGRFVDVSVLGLGAGGCAVDADDQVTCWGDAHRKCTWSDPLD